MSHYCRDCDVSFDQASLLPDGSCPECYSNDAVEVRSAKPPEVAVKVAENALPATRVPVPATAHPLHPLAITPLPQLPALDNLQFPSLPSLSAHDGPQKLHYPPHDHFEVPKPPSLDFIASQTQQYEYSQHLSPYHIYDEDGLLPAGRSVLYDNRQTSRRGSTSTGTRGRGAPRLPFNSQQGSRRGGYAGGNNGGFDRENFLPMEQLSVTVEQMTNKIMERLIVCADAKLLMEQAPILQSIIEKLQEVKTQFEVRVKDVLGGAVSVEQLTYGLDTPVASPSAAAAPEKLLELKPRRQRKKATSNTVVVRKLPPETVEADLRRHFEQFCDHPSEVNNINIAKDVNRRFCKGHAYVILQHENIVKKALAQKVHFIRKTQVTLSEFDEEEQLRRKRVYKIFISGLSSFKSNEVLEDLLEETCGEIEGLWFHPHKENPGVDNAYAYLSFVKPEVNDKVLEDGFILLNGRKLHCKKYTQQRTYLDEKKKDGKFGPPYNWRDRQDRERSNSGPDAPIITTTWSRSTPPPPKASTPPPAPTAQPLAAPPRAPVAGECSMCMDKPSNTLLKPCNHFGVCDECAIMVEECPFCRTKIESRERIFMQ